jgi:undecaprenyl-diphosphatase
MVNKKKNDWRFWATILASIAAIAFVVWQRKSILASLKEVSQADPVWLIVSVIAHISSVLAAAGVYWRISLKPTRYINLAVAQAASLFTSRVTPAGVGGLATMGRVLQTSGHSAAELGAVLSTNAIVTFLGNVTITIVALLISGRSVMDGFKIPKIIFLIPAFLAIGVAVVYFVGSFRNKVIAFIKDLVKTLGRYKHKKRGLIIGFVFGLLTTAGYMAALWAAGQSVGVSLSFVAAIVTISLGTLGASATPLPGGVVGAEATLALTMTQFGVPPEKALAVAFIYRFITYWLPILPGYIATQYALKKKIL